MTDDLNAHRNRLCNRLREQLWRYSSATLEFEQELGAEWFLNLWELVPTPDGDAHLLKGRFHRVLSALEQGLPNTVLDLTGLEQ